MKDHLQSHYSTISKSVVLIPILIIIFALVAKTGDRNQVSLKMAQFGPTVKVIQPTDVPDDKVYVDLEGPSTCVMKNSDYTVTVQIKKSQISAKMVGLKQTKQYILTEDCLFIWTLNEKNGIKKCDMSKVIPMVQGLADLHLLTINDMISALSKIGLQGSAFSSMKWDKPVCMKNEVSDTVFNVPSNIRFIDPTPVPVSQ